MYVIKTKYVFIFQNKMKYSRAIRILCFLRNVVNAKKEEFLPLDLQKLPRTVILSRTTSQKTIVVLLSLDGGRNKPDLYSVSFDMGKLPLYDM